MVRVAAAAACVLAVFAPAIMGAPLTAQTESVQAIKGSWSASVSPEFTSELQSSSRSRTQTSTADAAHAPGPSSRVPVSAAPALNAIG